MSHLPILSLVTFLPLVGALVILMTRADRETVALDRAASPRYRHAAHLALAA